MVGLALSWPPCHIIPSYSCDLPQSRKTNQVNGLKQSEVVGAQPLGGQAQS